MPIKTNKQFSGPTKTEKKKPAAESDSLSAAGQERGSGLVPFSAAQVLQMQHTLGNAVVLRMLAATHPPAAVQRDHRDDLIHNFNDSVLHGSWQLAAEQLNGFNNEDIQIWVQKLTFIQLRDLKIGALRRMPGWSDRVTKPIDTLNPEAGRIAQLIFDYNSAVGARQWDRVVVLLNGFNDEEIQMRLRLFEKTELLDLRQAALKTMPGWSQRVVEPIDAIIKQFPITVSDPELQNFKTNPPAPLKHFRPSTGVGDFNVRYDPGNNLFIDVHCYFNFVPGEQLFFILRSGKAIPTDKYHYSAEDPAVKTESRLGVWTAEDESNWKNSFFQAVKSKWSNRFRFYCTKPGWEELKPEAIVTFDEAPHLPNVAPDPQDKNFSITVKKGALAAGSKGIAHVTPGNLTSLAEWDSDDTKAHEAGHMLGLGDEYEDSKQPPEAAHSALVEAEFGSKVIRGQGDKNSIMKAGDQVLPEHGVTMLEALKAITKLDQWSHTSPKLGNGQGMEHGIKW